MKLKASERRLLTVFLSLFAVIVGGFGIMFAVRHFADAAGEVRALGERRDSLVQTLGESELWGERSRWIEEHIPTFGSREDASTQLLDAVSQKAESVGIEVRNKQLITDPNATTNEHPGLGEPAEPRRAAGIYFDRVAVVLEVDGDEEKIVRWLHEIQQPGAFMGVTHLTYSPTENGVRCNAQVSLWFREFSSPNLAKSP